MFDDLLGDFDFDAPSTDFDYATKEGWREFVDFVAQRPLSITLAEYDAMDSSERALFNIARERYMTLGARVATPALRQVAVAIRHAMADNRSPDASKSGVIISGRPGLGKTTAVQEFGRAFERARRQRAGDTVSRSLIPAAYVPVPTHATAKTMITKIADFYALPYSRNANYEALLSRVSHVMRECGTELVIVDDIHRLDLHYRGNEQVADALKELSERCPGTMVYAGVDVARNGLFWGSRGEQIMARFELVKFDAYDTGETDGAAVWGRILVDLEDSLCLISQPDGEILNVAAELRELSRGSIGRIARAVRRGARRAIEQHTERLDLDKVLASLAKIREAEGWVEEEEKRPSPRPKRGRPARAQV